MAKSKAKKFREKIERKGKRNPELSRSPFAFADLRSRRTKNKKDILYRCKHKNQSLDDGKRRDGSFYFVQKNDHSSLSVHRAGVLFKGESRIPST